MACLYFNPRYIAVEVQVFENMRTKQLLNGGV